MICRLANSGIFVGVLSMLGASSSAAEAELSAEQIVARVVSHAERAPGKNQTGFSYTKVTVTEELDSSGNVKERKEKVYQVSFNGAATTAKLVEVNGRAP